MKKNNRKYKFKVLALLIGIVAVTFGFLGDDKDGIKKPAPIYKISDTHESGKNGDAYAINGINNVYLPMNRKGNIANVNITEKGSGGQYAGNVFLFSAGFMLSGYSNGQLWANAVAPSSLVEDYVQGSVSSGQNDPNAVIYVLNSQDTPFGKSWQDWKDAVALGADFYNGDGVEGYDPVDKNGNGQWDPNEDRPDLIGDETVWCVYSDGLPVAQRRWNTTIKLGLEVRQTVFAFASAGAIGNLIFVRYRFKYVGLNQPGESQKLTDVYFGVFADPDLGDAYDDLVGSDVPRNAGFTYNDGTDPLYGNTPPCFMIDFFSGPVVYIPGETFVDNNGNNEYDEGTDTPLDTAHSVRGQIKGIVDYPGAKNLPISSFMEYRNGDPLLNDPANITDARNYMLGLNKQGEVIDPCTFPYGEVRGGVDCSTIDPRFWLSGDPVANVGWINTVSTDQRQMTNVGPFELIKDIENEIVVAYVVNNGANPIDAITKARSVDDGAQNIFNLNFLAPAPPPPPRVTITASEDFIDLTWQTSSQVPYINTTPTWDLRFQGFQVWAFRANINQDVINGQENAKIIASYSMDNFIANIYKENIETGGIELLYPEPDSIHKLNNIIYSDSSTGRLRLRIYKDPFNPNQDLIKGTPYYFAVTSYAINYDALIYKDDPSLPIGTEGDYYLSAYAFAQEAENIRNIQTIVMGENQYRPPVDVQPANRITGHSNGFVGFDIINNDELTNDLYEVSFFKKTGATFYNTYWRLTDVTTNTILIDSSLKYTYGNSSISEEVIKGFIPRIDSISAELGTPEYLPASSVWYDSLDLSGLGTGVSYIGQDLATNNINIGKPPQLPGQYSTQIHADNIRRVELRFGQQGVGKAYRYINGYKGGVFQSKLSYSYASAITPDDTVGKGTIGNWDLLNDRPNGWVDVPFTAWLVDPEFSNQEVQLAVGILERRRTVEYPTGTPDGIWDPTDSVIASGEYIFIFNTSYDPTGSQIEYSGGTFNLSSGQDTTVWSDLIKTSPTFLHRIPDDALGVTQEQRDIYDSPFFNTLYCVGLQRKNSNSFYTDGDKLIIPVAKYPYTNEDVYQFQTSTNIITSEQEKDLWQKVNVFPNPLYGFNPLTSYTGTNPDEPYVTFTNLPTDVTIKIYTLSGSLINTIDTGDKSSPTSPFLQWNLQNESGLRIASGMYIAIVSSPKFGDKVLKFAIIMPQKQIQRY